MYTDVHRDYLNTIVPLFTEEPKFTNINPFDTVDGIYEKLASNGCAV